MAFCFNKLSDRLTRMEACFEQHKGKNTVFDMILERIADDEAICKQT